MHRFFVSEGVSDFDPDKHDGEKFLYFVDDGSEILLVGDSEINTHQKLLEEFERLSNRKLDMSSLRGAGEIGFDEIGSGSPWPNCSWWSTGFKLETPPELQLRILELLTLPA